jgi:predicted MFS family arabinose efflux permease
MGFSIAEAYRGLPRPIWILAISMLVNRIGSIVIAFMTLYLVNDFGMSMSKAGTVMVAYGIGGVTGSYLGGWLSDRWDYYKTIVVTLIGSGLLLLPLLFLSNYYLILLNVLLYAIFADAFRPANQVAISHYSDDETRLKSITLMRLAVNLGFGLAPTLGGFAAVYFGYKSLFLFDCITSVAAGLIILYFLPKKEKIGSFILQPKPSLDSSAFMDKRFIVFISLVFMYGLMFFQLFASLPVFLNKVFNVREDTIGMLLGLNGLLVVVVEMPLVNYYKTFPRKNVLIAIGCIFQAIAFLVIGLHINMLIFFITYIFLATFSEIYAMPYMMDFVMQRASSERKGQYLALYSVAYAGSLIFATKLGLTLGEKYGFSFTYFLFAGITVLLGFAFYKMMDNAKKAINI